MVQDAFEQVKAQKGKFNVFLGWALRQDVNSAIYSKAWASLVQWVDERHKDEGSQLLNDFDWSRRVAVGRDLWTQSGAG